MGDDEDEFCADEPWALKTPESLFRRDVLETDRLLAMAARMNRALDKENTKQLMEIEWRKVQALMRPANHL